MNIYSWFWLPRLFLRLNILSLLLKLTYMYTDVTLSQLWECVHLLIILKIFSFMGCSCVVCCELMISKTVISFQKYPTEWICWSRCCMKICCFELIKSALFTSREWETVCFCNSAYRVTEESFSEKHFRSKFRMTVILYSIYCKYRRAVGFQWHI